MTPPNQQVALALAAIMDASLAAIDPTGASLRRACSSLRDGLRIAEQMGFDNDASAIVREVVTSIEELESQENKIV